MARSLNRLLSLIMAVIFIAVGIFIAYTGIQRLVKLNAGRYVETQAVITKIESRERYDSDTGKTETDYDLTVEYSVDGKTHVSHLGETPNDFYEGMELTVLYDVANPADVVLPGTTGAFIMIGMGVLAVICALVILLKNLLGR